MQREKRRDAGLNKNENRSLSHERNRADDDRKREFGWSSAKKILKYAFFQFPTKNLKLSIQNFRDKYKMMSISAKYIGSVKNFSSKHFISKFSNNCNVKH